MSSEWIYHEIKHHIIHMVYKPRQRLIESQLAKDFGTSRTPIRDALSKLVQEGWVIKVENQGYYVRSFTTSQVHNVYEISVALEELVLQLLVKRGDMSALQHLEQQWRAVPNTWNQTVGLNLLGADEEFHLALAIASGNDELVKYVRQIIDQRRIFHRINFYQKTWAERLISEHLAILGCLFQNDIRQAQQILREHTFRELTTILAVNGIEQLGD